MSSAEQGAKTHMDLRHLRIKRIGALLAAVGLLGGLALAPANVSADRTSMVAKVALGKVKTPVISSGGVNKALATMSGGTMQAALDDLRNEREVAADFSPQVESDQFSVTIGSLGCSTRNSAGGNVRANQDCTFRRQAEESIKINPIDSKNIIAGQNDSRVGYNKCGFDYSFDGGKTFGDGIPPFYQKENRPENDLPFANHSTNPNRNTILGGLGTHHTYDAGSDPALTFDSAGRAFFSCVLFDVNTNANGVLVTQSPQGAGGSFYDNVAAAGRNFVVVEDNNDPDPITHIFPHVVAHDKEFITADTFANSPNRDNVYVTWTVFDFKNTCAGATPDGPTQCSSAIFGSMSTDHALTWSTPEEISGRSPLCSGAADVDPSAAPDACNNDQGSDPVVLPDGRLAVVFNNGNTPRGNPNAQQLNVTCRPTGSSTDGTAHLNCGAPTKVGSDILLGEPQCDFGRGPEECIPGPWIRTNDFPRMAIDKSNGALYAVWQDYRNQEFDIVIARSNDGGATWDEGDHPVNKFEFFDEYMPAVDVGTNHNVAVSFYKSIRVPDENATPPGGFVPFDRPGGQTGVRNEPSTYWLSGRRQPTQFVQTPFTQIQISPIFAPPDGAQIGFNGDYSGIAVVGSRAHPIWSDTRNTAVVTAPTQGVVHDEDVFTDDLEIPHP